MYRTLALAAALVLVPRAALAGTLSCDSAEADAVTVDGMLDDWQGVARDRAGGKDADQSFDVRCLVAGTNLALSIDVRDEHLTRLRKATAKQQAVEDHLELQVGGVTLRLWPGKDKEAPRRQLIVKGKAKPLPKWIAVEDTQQPKGWSVELTVPLAHLTGGADASSEAAKVTFVDADDETVHTTTSLSDDLTLTLGGSAPVATTSSGGDLVSAFLKDAHLAKKDIVLETKVGDERLVAAGKFLAVIGDKYAYVELPVDSVAGVEKVTTADLRGDGGREFVALLRESDGSGGSRDVVAVFGAAGGQIDPLFSVEVRRESGESKIESTWTLEPRKQKGKTRGQELRVVAGTAVGWDQDTFSEEAGDAEPLHLPWDDQRHGGVYWLDGTTMRSQVLKK